MTRWWMDDGESRNLVLLFLVIAFALVGCENKAVPARAKPLDARAVRTLVVAAEMAESSAEQANRTILGQGALDYRTLADARERRVELGQHREDAVVLANKLGLRPELAEARAHVERALALDEESCDHLDEIIERLTKNAVERTVDGETIAPVKP